MLSTAARRAQDISRHGENPRPRVWYNRWMPIPLRMSCSLPVSLLAFALLLLTLPRWLLQRQVQARIFAASNAPEASYALVLGAGLRRDGSPTAVLADRVSTAIDLYRTAKARTLIMSGATSNRGEVEAEAMAGMAMRMGVPASALILDREGDRTLSSCINAAKHSGNGRLLIVTQRFHLPRALLLCEALGVQAYGVEADRRTYRTEPYWKLREAAATLRALWDAGWISVSGPAATWRS